MFILLLEFILLRKTLWILITCSQVKAHVTPSVFLRALLISSGLLRCDCSDANLGALRDTTVSRAHTWNHVFLFVFFVDSFLSLPFSFFFIQFVVRRREPVHLNSQITKRALELFPIIDVVKQLEAVGFDQRLVHVGELLRNGLHQELNNKLFVGRQWVRCSILLVDWCLDLQFLS